MKLHISILSVALLLAACGRPEVVPVPVTQGPTLPPETPAPVPPVNAPIVSPPALVSIHMVDGNNGWGINDNDVLRTEDGGVTWYDVSPSGVSALGYSAISDFLDVTHGWVLVPDSKDPLVGMLYRTGDGGKNWASASVPFGTGDLQFLDSKQGWVMAGLGVAAGSMGVAVFQTSDGGATWTQTYTNDPNQANAGESLPLAGLKDGLTALDMQTAWVGGIIYAPGTIYLYQTRDGGRSWGQVPVKVPAGYEQAEFETIGPQFVTAKDAYMPVHVTSQNGVMLAIYATHDGGLNWSLTPTMIPQGGSMDFVSPSAGLVWNSSAFYVTHDGGGTWTITPPDVAFGEGFAGMDFVDAATGFTLTNDVTGTRGLYKTSDGGATWSALGK